MPQRFLRPGLTTSQRFNAVTYAAQTLYVRLITLVDDFGRYDAELRLLRSHAFPFGDPAGKEIPVKTLESMCEQLSAGGLAIFYVTPDGKKYLQVVRWQEKARAEKSKYPAFDNTCEQMFTSDNKCYPPSPSPSPSPSPAIRRHSSHGSQANTSEPDNDEAWIANLSRNTAYEGIDVRREHARMVVWCETHKKQPTRRRFINWLNKAEKPLRAVPKAKPLDPSKIELPERFKSWAGDKYHDRKDEIMGWKTWAEVPGSLRTEWWTEEKAKLPVSI